MPALERLAGLRVVATPGAIDDARWTGDDVLVLRLAPDDAFAIRATAVAVDDPHAIVVDDHGFVGAWCTLADVTPHVEWWPPVERPVLAQGAVAGVPAKAWIETDDRVLLVATVAAAATLAERLGWSLG